MGKKAGSLAASVLLPSGVQGLTLFFRSSAISLQPRALSLREALFLI